MAKDATKPAALQKRACLKQSDVTLGSLDDALRIPQAILDHYAGKPTTPLHVAKALDVDPKGSQIRVLCSASVAEAYSLLVYKSPAWKGVALYFHL